MTSMVATMVMARFTLFFFLVLVGQSCLLHHHRHSSGGGGGHLALCCSLLILDSLLLEVVDTNDHAGTEQANEPVTEGLLTVL